MTGHAVSGAGEAPGGAGTHCPTLGTHRAAPSDMNNDLRTENVTRENVLKLLSDNEVASVSTAETAPRLLDGEEYLDLEHLDRGVQQASKLPTVITGVLPRRTVHKDTWGKIVALLGQPSRPIKPI